MVGFTCDISCRRGRYLPEKRKTSAPAARNAAGGSGSVHPALAAVKKQGFFRRP